MKLNKTQGEVNTTKKYPAIDLMKFICSIMVIVVHTSSLLPHNHFANSLLIHTIARVAIPFFFIANGFFIQEHIKRYGNQYVKK